MPGQSITTSLTRAKSREHLGKRFGTDVEVFADPPPQHGGRDIAPTTFLLRLMQNVQHNPLLTCQPVADIRYPVVGVIVAGLHGTGL